METEAERRAEIPIVQLNPGGILNWKYKVRTQETKETDGMDGWMDG